MTLELAPARFSVGKAWFGFEGRRDAPQPAIAKLRGGGRLSWDLGGQPVKLFGLRPKSTSVVKVSDKLPLKLLRGDPEFEL